MIIVQFNLIKGKNKMLNVKINTIYLATILLQAYADHGNYLSDDERELISQYCADLDLFDIENLEEFIEYFISDHEFVKTEELVVKAEELERDIYQNCEVLCVNNKYALIQL